MNNKYKTRTNRFTKPRLILLCALMCALIIAMGGPALASDAGPTQVDKVLVSNFGWGTPDFDADFDVFFYEDEEEKDFNLYWLVPMFDTGDPAEMKSWEIQWKLDGEDMKTLPDDGNDDGWYGIGVMDLDDLDMKVGTPYEISVSAKKDGHAEITRSWTIGVKAAPRTYAFKGTNIINGAATPFIGPFVEPNLTKVTGKIFYNDHKGEGDVVVTQEQTPTTEQDGYYSVEWNEANSSYTITTLKNTDSLTNSEKLISFGKGGTTLAKLEVSAIDTTPTLKMRIKDAEGNIVTAVPKNYEGVLTAEVYWRPRVAGYGMPTEDHEADLDYAFWGPETPSDPDYDRLLTVGGYDDGSRKIKYTVKPGETGTITIANMAQYKESEWVGGEAKTTLNIYDTAGDYVLESGESQAKRLVVRLDHSGTTTAEVELLNDGASEAITDVTPVHSDDEVPGKQPIWTLEAGKIKLDCDFGQTGRQFGTFTYKIDCADGSDVATLVVLVVRSMPELGNISYDDNAEMDMDVNPDGFHVWANEYYPAFDEDGMLGDEVEFRWTTDPDNTVYKPKDTGWTSATKMLMQFVAPGEATFSCEIRHGEGRTDSLVGSLITVTGTTKAKPVVSGDVSLAFVAGSGSQTARFSMMDWAAKSDGASFPLFLHFEADVKGVPTQFGLDCRMVDATAYKESFELAADWTRADEGANDCYGLGVYSDLGIITVGGTYKLYVQVGPRNGDANKYNKGVADTYIGTMTINSPTPPGPFLAQPVLTGSNSLTGRVGELWDGRAVKANLSGAAFVADGKMAVTVKLGELTKTVEMGENGDLSAVFGAAELNALAVGAYSITASTEADSLNYASSADIGSLTVNDTDEPDPAPVEGKVTMPKTVKITAGFSAQLVTLTEGNTMPVFTKIASKDNKIATLDADGVLTGVKRGKVVVYYKLNGKTKKCTVTVVKNQYGWKKAVTGKKGTITLSTGRLEYMDGHLHMDVWVSNRTRKTLKNIEGLKYELYDKDGNVLLSMPFALMRKVPAGKSVFQCLHVSEEMLPGVADKVFDLALGGLRATITGWEDAITTGKAIFEGDDAGDADELAPMPQPEDGSETEGAPAAPTEPATASEPDNNQEGSSGEPQQTAPVIPIETEEPEIASPDA